MIKSMKIFKQNFVRTILCFIIVISGLCGCGDTNKCENKILAERDRTEYYTNGNTNLSFKFHQTSREICANNDTVSLVITNNGLTSISGTFNISVHLNYVTYNISASVSNLLPNASDNLGVVSYQSINIELASISIDSTNNNQNPSGVTNLACSALPLQNFNGIIANYPIGTLGTYVAGRLKTIWHTQPTAIFAYQPAPYLFGCGGPLPSNNAMYCPADDFIYYDQYYMNQLQYMMGNFASATFIAHEWGHLNQQRLGLLSPSGSSKPYELHSDCQAGIFAAIEESTGFLGQSDIPLAFSSFCTQGDPFLSPWFAAGAHGTCIERNAAFAMGYQGAKANLSSVCGTAPLTAMRSICRSYLP